MNDKIITSVPFDPGITQYYPPIEEDITDQIEGLSRLKLVNQRKFQMQKLETKLIRPLNTIMAIYYGCVIYGSVIASKYKNSAAEVTDNPMISMPEEELKYLDLSAEAKAIIEIYHKANKSVTFNLRRKSKLPEKLEEYTNLYIDFVLINNHFKDLKSTDQIKLPDATRHFKEYSKDKLNELEQKIRDIAQKGNLEELLNIS